MEYIKFGVIPLSAVALILSIVVYFGINPKTHDIDTVLESGLQPKFLSNTTHIDRSDIVDKIRDQFILNNASNFYGVILGPSGTGKSHLTRLTCNLNPKGVIYIEISYAKFFPQELAKAIGMRLREDANLLHFFLDWIGFNQDYTFYSLPSSLSDAMAYVLKTLAERAEVYKKKFNRKVCVFIDGVEILAQHFREVYTELIRLAKYYAADMLRIVLISTEGHVIPLIYETSAMTRKADVIEILDINYEDSINHLTMMGVSNSLASKIFNLTGGRFIHLDKAIELNKYRGTSYNEDELFTLLEEILIHDYVDVNADVFFKYDMAKHVIKHVISNYTIAPGKLYDPENESNTVKVVEAIAELVTANLLRYTARGNVTWHSQVVRHAILNNLENYIGSDVSK